MKRLLLGVPIIFAILGVLFGIVGLVMIANNDVSYFGIGTFWVWLVTLPLRAIGLECMGEECAILLFIIPPISILFGVILFMLIGLLIMKVKR